MEGSGNPLQNDKIAGNKVVQSIKQLSPLLDLSDDLMGYFDQNGMIQYTNSAHILGYTVSEAIGTSIFNYIDSEDIPLVRKALERVIKNPKETCILELRLISKKGSIITCKVKLNNFLHDPSIRGIIFLFQDITENKRLSKEMKHWFFYDDLTGLRNRISFENELIKQINQAKCQDTSFAIMLLDIDGFKYINDSLTHAVGDILLKNITAILKDIFQNDDIDIYRIDGDEFACIVRNVDEIEKIHQTANNLLTTINKKPFKINENEFFVSASIGISIFPNSGETHELLMKNAEMAMYKAKENGKNQYQIFNPTMNIYHFKQFTLRNDARSALINNEYSIYYQPRVNPLKNEMVSAEALIRWNHSKWGIISPDEFIPMAEKSGLIIPIGTWTIRKICLQIKTWEEKNIPIIKISINLSAVQLLQNNFVYVVSSILEETKVNPKWIEFEITETAMIDNEEQVINAIIELKKLGISFALDDYGTGYSSLNYLRNFPCDIIKIDKSVIQDSSNETYEIVKYLISLCHRLDKSVVAEGVETIDQLTLMKNLHCDEIQGYYYSKPVNEKEFEKLLIAGKCSHKSNAAAVPKTNRRKYFRVPLEVPLIADMTIEKFGHKKLHLGSIEIFVQNIGPGGLCFQSTLKLPVSREIILKFTTEIFSNDIELNGSIVWINELNNGKFQYGVEFIVNEILQENLVKVLNQLQIKLKHSSVVPNCRFFLN